MEKTKPPVATMRKKERGKRRKSGDLLGPECGS
jgi:hypothetical protein